MLLPLSVYALVSCDGADDDDANVLFELSSACTAGSGASAGAGAGSFPYATEVDLLRAGGADPRNVFACRWFGSRPELAPAAAAAAAAAPVLRALLLPSNSFAYARFALDATGAADDDADGGDGPDVLLV